MTEDGDATLRQHRPNCIGVKERERSDFLPIAVRERRDETNERMYGYSLCRWNESFILGFIHAESSATGGKSVVDLLHYQQVIADQLATLDVLRACYSKIRTESVCLLNPHCRSVREDRPVTDGQCISHL